MTKLLKLNRQEERWIKIYQDEFNWLDKYLEVAGCYPSNSHFSTVMNNKYSLTTYGEIKKRHEVISKLK